VKRKYKSPFIWGTGLGVVLAVIIALVLTGTVFATHSLGANQPFELDGNVANDGALAGEDWANVYAGNDTAVASVFVQDDGADGIDDLDEINYLGGGSKDDLDIPNWEWDTSPVPDKNDIIDAGAALYTYTGPEVCGSYDSGDPRCTRTGDPIIYFFLDRLSAGRGTRMWASGSSRARTASFPAPATRPRARSMATTSWVIFSFSASSPMVVASAASWSTNGWGQAGAMAP